MNERPTAIVIGAGIGGLCAAAYLAREGVATTVLEARGVVGGGAETAMLGESFRVPLDAHVFYALDRRMMRDLSLHRLDLEFAEREMPTVALRPGGEHLIFPRDMFGTRAAIRAHAAADADAYVRYRQELFGFARALRPLWLSDEVPNGGTGDLIADAARRCRLNEANRKRLEAFARSSASAHLDHWFESDALKAAFGFDVALEGASPSEAGTTLLLAWRAAQDAGGLQGATTQFRGGPLALATALTKAAQNMGASVRTATRVNGITVTGGRLSGVVLGAGERLAASVIVSSLSRAATMKLLPLEAAGFSAPLAAGTPPVSNGKVLLGLNGPVPIAGLGGEAGRGRLIIAERPESAAEAKGAALAGRIPSDLVLEITIPSIADPSAAPVGQSAVSVLMPMLPAEIDNGWDAHRDVLLRRVIAKLEVYAPGLSERIVEKAVYTPDDLASRYGTGRVSVSGLSRLLQPGDARVRMPVPGLYLCGATAEAADATSGAAGRVAAQCAVQALKKAEAAS